MTTPSRRLTAAGTAFLQGGADGPAPGLPLVCLHGIGGDATSFAAQIDGLAGPARRVLSWDMPGYGGSAPLSEMRFETLCDRLCAALDALGLDRVVLAGQSIGGMIAQEMAIRHPRRIAGLVLIAGGEDDNSPPRVMEKMASRLADASFQVIETAGHLVNSEAPEACNLAIEAFLRRLAGDGQMTNGTQANA